MIKYFQGFVAVIAIATAVVSAADFTIASDTVDKDNVRRIQLESPYQKGVLVRIIAGKNAFTTIERRFLFVLPVEANEQTKYGDGLSEIIKENLHEKYNLIVVAPSFAQLPWYADHPTDPAIRQESYFLKSVLPLIDRLYPSKSPKRLLLGFSKSGWGAYSLMLRNPELFSAAAAWDAPLMKEKPDQFGMGDIFGTQENFEGYRISRLLREKADVFGKSKRFNLAGYFAFRQQTQDAHALMESLKIPHEYADGPRREHVWASGWVTDAVKFLDEASK